jgi:hypothetical protein
MTDNESTNIFGFSTEASSGGDFIPIIKYDSRSGRIFRVDRNNDGTGWNTDLVDITSTFRAVFDFENVEVGWIAFPLGAAPSFRLVPIGTQLPTRPDENHKNGLRVMMKLDKACGGEHRIREVAGTAKAFLGGVEQIFAEYLRQKKDHPGQLPVISLVSTMPMTTGSGAKQSTNYRPLFRIDGYVARPDDLAPNPVTKQAAIAPTPPPSISEHGNGYSQLRPVPPVSPPLPETPPWDGQHPVPGWDYEKYPLPQLNPDRMIPPLTGSQVMPKPVPGTPAVNLEDDFG